MGRVLRTCLILLACATLGFAQRLTLQEACALALRNNPRIGVDSLAPLIADEASTAARSARYPTIMGHSSAVSAFADSRLSAAGAINNPIIFSRVAVGVSANQILTDFGRTSNLIESAKLRADSQRQSVQATRGQILLAVHRAYLTALRSRKTKEVTEQARAQLKSTSELAIAEASFEATAARNEYAVALTELAALLGAPQQTYELVEPDLASDAPPTAAELIAEALRSRPEIAALHLEREAAARFAKAEEKLAMPVVFAIGYTGVAPAHSARLNPRYAAAGVLLNVPIFNGHLFEARKRDAQLRLQAVDRRLKELEATISREAAIAALHADTAYQRILLVTQVVRQASSDLDRARESKTDLPQPLNHRSNTELRLAEARYDYQMLRSAIDFQLGRLR